MSSKTSTQKGQAVHVFQRPVVIAHHLKDDGMIPNNEKLPLLIYKGSLRLPGKESAEAIEQLLQKNRWSASWRNGIYTYHHYHSTAHEVLLVYGHS